MPTFADREKEFEARFKHDEELRFKTTARRNYLAGLWAAERLGRSGETAEAYAREVVAAQFEPSGTQSVIAKLAADLGTKDPAFTPARIEFELAHFTAQAKQQLLKDNASNRPVAPDRDAVAGTGARPVVPHRVVLNAAVVPKSD